MITIRYVRSDCNGKTNIREWLEGSERNSEGIVEKYSHSGERPEWSRIEFSLPFTPLILLHNAILEGAARDGDDKGVPKKHIFKIELSPVNHPCK